MRFRRSIQRYGDSPVPDTAYARAGQVWDDRIGSARVQAHNWRRIALANSGLALLLAGGLIWQSRQSRIIPYLVAVDHAGAPNVIGPADQVRNPDGAEIAWFLGHFIQDVRTIGLDPVLTRHNWLEAYDFASPRGATFLNLQARKADPFAQQGMRTISVQLVGIVAISDRSYQVRWSETAYVAGNKAGTSQWTAVLTIILQPPRTIDAVKRNPLGILIDGIDWSEDIEGVDHSTAASALPVSGPILEGGNAA